MVLGNSLFSDILLRVVLQEKLRLSGKSKTCIVLTNEETSSSEVLLISRWYQIQSMQQVDLLNLLHPSDLFLDMFQDLKESDKIELLEG